MEPLSDKKYMEKIEKVQRAQRVQKGLTGNQEPVSKKCMILGVIANHEYLLTTIINKKNKLCTTN